MIANGEISVIAAVKYGVPAVCITGGEKDSIPEDLLTVLKTTVPPDNPIIIAMDCDHQGRKSAQGLCRQLGTHWRSVRAVDLHLTDGGDLADYVRIHRHKSYDTITQLPDLLQINRTKATIPDDITVGKIGASTFIWAKDVHKLPPIEWLLKDEIPHRALTVLYGPPGSVSHSSRSTFAYAWPSAAQSSTSLGKVRRGCNTELRRGRGITEKAKAGYS